MTLYLTDNSTADEVLAAQRAGFVKAVKYYPAGATTNSDSGVTDLAKCEDVFAAMQESGLPLLMHGEVTGDSIDVFDREAVFIQRHLVPLLKRFPRLKVVLEHITTRQGAEFVMSRAENLAATVTPQHLLFSRNAIFKGGLNPHFYCLPVLKREEHRVALMKAATSGSPKFFLGTDSAPHAKNRKEACCGAAGCYSALHALELYAEAFESVGALDRLEGFASFHGADFYGLPRNRGTVTLVKGRWTVPDAVPFPEAGLVPLMAGESLSWRFAG